MTFADIIYLPNNDSIHNKFSFKIESDLFTIEYDNTYKLYYYDKELGENIVILTFDRNKIIFPTFTVSMVFGEVNKDSDGVMVFNIPDKIQRLTNLPKSIKIKANHSYDVAVTFLKIIATRYSCFHNYENRIRNSVSVAMRQLTDYFLQTVFLQGIDEHNLNDYLAILENTLKEKHLLSLIEMEDDDGFSISFYQQCVNDVASLQSIIIFVEMIKQKKHL